MKSSAGSAGGGKSIDLQQVSYAGFSLKGLLQDAYRVKKYQVSGPDWIDTQRYDVVGKLPEGAPKEQVAAMLQSLLAERFRMSVHEEIRQDRIYALVVGKGGPHLTKSDVKEGRNDPVPQLEVHDGRIEFRSATLDSFTTTLSAFLDSPVLDMTGIQGSFDISIKEDGGPPDSIPDSNFTSSILAAMQELGLKLESRLAPIRHIVVDSAEKVPTGN